jgi:carbonic anhydrase
VKVAGTIDPSKLLPADLSYMSYPGSLTTPPCSEGLSWFMLRTPAEWSTEQIDAFRALPNMDPSNRPLQPLHGRVVKLSGSH